MILRLTILAALLVLSAHAAPERPRALMSGDQVVQILDETVDWYRTLGIQQQAATQPSDLLILYANRQVADKVVTLGFEIARANAELLSSEAAATERENSASAQSLSRIHRKLGDQRTAIQAQIDASERALAAAPKASKPGLQARISVLRGELDLINARRNMLANMEQFAGQNDAEGSGANALKAHIDAIAASIPSSGATTLTAASGSERTQGVAPESGARFSPRESGIWDLGSSVLKLSAKSRTIDTVERRTAELQEVFAKIRTPPLERLKALGARGDALAAQSDAASVATLKDIRDQYDTLAWLFQQTASIVTPLSKATVLLTQYRNNLESWRLATRKQYYEALGALGLRIAFFVGLLAVVFAAAQLWRRLAFRYVADARRRARLLLVRKIVLWSLVIVIAISAFATELGSLATFAGLITAGLAVAMQSVLVSVVGYFFLIGKYGIRVGDRVQIGNVTGEVIDLGLVRMHLMELSGQGLMSPTGRVVAFANSIIFQASGGLFKQIPGVNLAWHEITVSLPAGSDFSAMKDRIAEVATEVIKDYRDDIMRQTQEIQRTASSKEVSDPKPQVQLRFSASGVEAVLRYPVQLQHAGEIDERISREVLGVAGHNDAVTAPR